MSKKEDRLWNEGFERACEIAEKDGLERLMQERNYWLYWPNDNR